MSGCLRNLVTHAGAPALCSVSLSELDILNFSDYKSNSSKIKPRDLKRDWQIWCDFESLICQEAQKQG